MLLLPINKMSTRGQKLHFTIHCVPASKLSQVASTTKSPEVCFLWQSFIWDYMEEKPITGWDWEQKKNVNWEKIQQLLPALLHPKFHPPKVALILKIKRLSYKHLHDDVTHH